MKRFLAVSMFAVLAGCASSPPYVAPEASDTASLRLIVESPDDFHRSGQAFFSAAGAEVRREQCGMSYQVPIYWVTPSLVAGSFAADRFMTKGLALGLPDPPAMTPKIAVRELLVEAGKPLTFSVNYSDHHGSMVDYCTTEGTISLKKGQIAELVYRQIKVPQGEGTATMCGLTAFALETSNGAVQRVPLIVARAPKCSSH
ncbi:hypothetical protein [Ralstonia pickettii]|nr:hypothetical protein [Ralstonia pickettii]